MVKSHMTLVKLLIGTVLVFFFGNFGITGFRVIFFQDFRNVADPDMDINDPYWPYFGGFLMAIGLIGIVLGIFLIRRTLRNAK